VDTWNPVMLRDAQEQLQALARPRRADSFTIKLYTTEIERVVRAW
jgi:hypothetical protein